MAAVFDVMIDYGGSDTAPGTAEVATNLRFNRADDNVQDTSEPIPIPGAGTIYSYWKHIYLKCTTGPVTSCNNFKYYSDGAGMDTGVLIKVGTNAVANDSDYNVADGADEMVANHSGVDASADVNGYTSGGSQLALGVVPGDDVIDDVDEETDYLVLQLNVSSTASAGNITSKTHTFQYDEI